MQLHAVIFDLDGVLIDTARAHQDAWTAAIGMLCIDVGERVLPDFRGVHRETCLDIILGADASQDGARKELSDLKTRLYLERVEELGPAITTPGARELVISLRQAGLRLGVASASRNAQSLLARADLRQFVVPYVSDGTYLGPPKPEPRQLTYLAEQMGVSARACTVLEDATSGIRAARNAGMRAIGIGNSVESCAGLSGWYPSLAAVPAHTLLRSEL